MADLWRNRVATAQRVWLLFRQDVFPEAAWDDAHHAANLIPSRRDWRWFIDLILLLIGTVFILAGVIFFFAFNWEDMPRFWRFAIVQAGTVIAVLLVPMLRFDTWPGRMALAASTIMIGVTFAVVGQEYQTGADSYRLFQTWLLVIIGWVLISRWNVMYLLWMILLNFTLSLYWFQVVGDQLPLLNALLFAANISFIVIWEILAEREVFEFMFAGRWITSIAVVAELVHMTYFALLSIALWPDPFQTNLTVLPFLYVVGVLLLGGLYGYLRYLPALAAIAISLIIVLDAILVRILFENVNWDNLYSLMVSFFFIGAFTIGLAVGFGRVLLSLRQRWESQS